MGELFYGVIAGAVALSFCGWWWTRAAVTRDVEEAFREDVKVGLWAAISSGRWTSGRGVE